MGPGYVLPGRQCHGLAVLDSVGAGFFHWDSRVQALAMLLRARLHPLEFISWNAFVLSLMMVLEGTICRSRIVEGPPHRQLF